MKHRTHFRVVVDGDPKLPAPVVTYEQHRPPLGWLPVTEGASLLAQLQSRWICRIQAEDAKNSFDYDVEIKTRCNVAELNQVLQEYAKNLVEGIDPETVNLLKLTATALH